jgi:hypothetical protein
MPSFLRWSQVSGVWKRKKVGQKYKLEGEMLAKKQKMEGIDKGQRGEKIRGSMRR